MELTSAYYLAKIREGLSLKQRSNPHYSLRAYARDIGIHPATLSQIINGKRALPVKDSEKVIKKLNLGPKERSLFIDSLTKSRTFNQIKINEEDNRILLDESHYKIISEWEHFAVLELFHIDDFQRTKEDVAHKLDLTLNRADVVINNLLIAKLIELDEAGKMVKVHEDVKTTDDISSQALVDSHKETMQMGIRKIDEIALELRDFSSWTLAVDLNKFHDAKLLIKEFRKKMAALLSEGDKKEVYQLAIQFYPLSNLESIHTQEQIQ
jgi:uncharacterized protein (TIGR02147 family)